MSDVQMKLRAGRIIYLDNVRYEENDIITVDAATAEFLEEAGYVRTVKAAKPAKQPEPAATDRPVSATLEL